jgi:aminoethylphosphonate catabolism LysR family transcriptional regulator
MYHKWLQAFHAVAREGGFTAAARSLNVSQPTISIHVKALEEQFGVELIHRHRHTLELTPVGQSLLTITQGLYGHEDEAIKLLRSAQQLEAGVLKVGAIGPYDVMELLQHFHDMHPKVGLSVNLGAKADVLAGLLEYGTDVGILGEQETDPRFHQLFYNRYEVVVIVNNDHPWARRKRINIQELAGQPMVLRTRSSTTRVTFERALQEAGVEIQPVMEINNREAVREAVVRGLGIGVVSQSEFISGEHLRALRVTGARMQIDAYVACLAERLNRPLISAFFTVTEKLIKQRTRKTCRIKLPSNNIKRP